MDTNHYLEKIIAYESGELSLAEKKVFEEGLKTDTDFQQFYQHWKDSKNVQEVLAYKTLRNQLKQMETRQKGMKVFWKRQLQIAAGFLLLICAGSFFYANSQFSNSKISNQFYKQPNFSPNRDVNNKSVYDQALQDFNTQNYKDCIAKLQEAPSPESQYLLAHALYSNQEYSAAVDAFISVTKQKDPRNEKVAQWHLILSLLQDKKTPQALEIIKTISSDKNHAYAKEALQLEKKLKNPLRGLVWN